MVGTPQTTKSRAGVSMYLVVILAILVSALLNTLLPLEREEYSDSPTSYATFSEYTVRHIVRTGHELKEDDVPIRTPYTSGVLIGEIRPLFNKYYAMIVLVIDDSPLESYEVRPFIGIGLSISLIFAVCMITRKVSKEISGSVTKSEYALLSVTAILSTPALITYLNGGFYASAVLSWILILLIFSLLLGTKLKVERLLLIVFLLLLPAIYYTPALILLILFTSLFVYQKILRKRILPSNLVLLYGVFFFAFYMFVATGFFRTMALAIPKFISFFSAESRVSALDVYVTSGSTVSQVLNLTNAILVSVPVLYYFFLGNKHLKNTQHLRHLTLGIVVSLLPMSVFFYLWAGSMGVYWRMVEWGGLISVIVLCVIIVSVKGRDIKYLKTAALGAIIIAPIIVFYTSPDITAFGYSTQSEEQGQIWLAHHITSSDVVFTDHRLIGAFVLENHLNVLGVNDNDDPILVEKQLRAIYYENDSESAYFHLTTDYHSDYLFLSHRMTNRPPGIKGFDYFFEAAPDTFLEKYESSPHFLKLYDNGVSESYAILQS